MLQVKQAQLYDVVATCTVTSARNDVLDTVATTPAAVTIIVPYSKDVVKQLAVNKLLQNRFCIDIIYFCVHYFFIILIFDMTMVGG